MALPAAPPRYFPRPMHSVLSELASTLDALESRMAAIADNGTDAHELAVVLPILIQTRDVCAVTGLNGPHLLLVEMVRVVEGVIEGDYEHPFEANNALMFAAARLPGYIHRLLLGGRDLPLALLPVLNDLRAVRGAPLLSDAVMRLPLFRLPPDDLGASNAEDGLAAAARQVRPHYMRALLNLIRGEAAAGSLELIAGCLKTLRDHSRRRSVRMLWLIARGLVDGLHSGSLELKPATKSLLGQIDQCVKLAVVHGERDLVVSLPPELLRSLLFYCAQAGDASDVLRVVRQRYQLEDIGRLAASEDGALERAAQLPAPGLLYAARDQVLEELDRVRDAVLAFAHSDVSPAETLQPAGLLLERVCETLGVLGFSAARTTLNASLPMFQRIRDRHTSARALGTLAEVLLQGGRLLDAELDRQSGADDDLDCSQELDVDQSALTRMPREERRQLLAAVLLQLRAALDAFESAVVAHRSGDVSQDVLLTACDGLRDASRALDIVPLRAAHDAFQRLVGWLDHTLATATDLSDLSESHALVEAVAGLDFYLRAMAENDLNGRGFLRACFTALTSLEQDVSFQSAQTDEHDTVEPIIAASADVAESPELAEPEPVSEPAAVLAVPAHALDRADVTPRYCLDAQLRTIFVAEAHEHLTALREQLQVRTDDGGGVAIDDHSRQLLTAFAQRAQLAEVGSIAALLARLDRLFAYYQRSSASVSAIEMELVTRTLASVESSLDNLTVNQACDPGTSELVSELDSMAAVLGVEGDADAQDTAAELRSVFLEEADELIAAAMSALSDWQAQPKDSASAERLMRSLHTLKGSARVAGCIEIADRAHGMESDVASTNERTPVSSRAELSGLQHELDRIADAVCREASPVGSIAPPIELPAPKEPDATPAQEPVNPIAVPPMAASVESPRDDADDMLRVSSQAVGDLASLASDVALHRVALHDSLQETHGQLDELSHTVRRLEELMRVSSDGAEAVPTAPAVQESLRDCDAIQQTIRDQLRIARAALDAQRQSGGSLQDGLLKLRLLSVESVVPRLQRVVRQSTEAFGKSATLSVVGGDVTLDRGLLARIAGPLEHLVRNAVAHGIETPAERERADKDPVGRIVVHASQQQGTVQIRVADDGRGVDIARVRKTAEERGLDTALDDDALVRLILSPGFSTLDAVDGHAGRGVGLDVVNRHVREAGGNLSIQTQPGAGTAFGLRVPQALTIEKAVLVRAGDSRFAVPVSHVVAIEHVAANVVRDIYLKESGTYGYDGGSFPVYHLGGLVGVSDWQPEAADETESLLLLDLGGQRVALHVDSIVSQRELPVRSGGQQLQLLRGFSGASVMGDGEVILILDVAGLLLERAGHDALVEVGDETRVFATDFANTVMVVDDSVTMRRANSRALVKGGYRVLHARNGLDALQQMQDDLVDALVLDLDMPGMDGYQLLEHLRADDATRTLPVVVVSARSGDDSRARVQALGVEWFLEKPCRGNQLLEALDKVLLGATVA